MKNKHHGSSFQLAPMALIYFAFFTLAIVFDAKERLIQYPYTVDLNTVVSHFVFSMLMALLVVVIGLLMKKYLPSLKNLSQSMGQILGQVSITEAFLISASSSLSEEFFFRGVLQAKLGLPLASILFGLLHVGPNITYWPWTLFAILMGFFLGFVYQWFGDIMMVVAIHFAINFINLMLMRKEIKNYDESGPLLKP